MKLDLHEARELVEQWLRDQEARGSQPLTVMEMQEFPLLWVAFYNTVAFANGNRFACLLGHGPLAVDRTTGGDPPVSARGWSEQEEQAVRDRGGRRPVAEECCGDAAIRVD